MILTRHAVERFIERFRREIEENKINVKHERAVRWLMYIFIENGQETKSHLNDTDFMCYVWKTYGYDTKYRFIENGRVIFIVVVDVKSEETKEVVVTCIPNRKVKKLPKSKRRIYNGCKT